MKTQQAISFLTNTATTLSNSLIRFGLENNGETAISLREKVDQSVKKAFNIREQLFSKLEMLKAKELQAEDELSFAISNQSLEKGRLAELQKQRSLLETAIQNLQGNKQLLSDTGDSKKATIKAEINIIKANITKTESEVVTVKKQIADGLALVANYDSLRVQAQSAQEQANYHNQYVQYWGVVGREGGRSGKSKDIYGWITNTAQVNARDSFQAQANQFTQQAAAIQGQVDSFKQSLPVLEGTKNNKTDQIWLYYQELDAKNNVLSFVSTQSGNDVALLDLQLNQSQTDLAQLKNVDIPSQRTTTDGTTQRVTQVQSELDQLKTQKVSAQKDLDSFNQSNKELLTTDLSLELLQDSITKSRAKVTSLGGDLAKPNQSTELINSLTQALALEQAKLGQLKQQYQLAALEVLAVNQDRLESLEGQLAAETSVGGAVKETTIGGYVVLVSQFAEQLTGLSDIWAESLKENHQFTVEVSNLFDSNLTAFVGVKQFIEDNLAVPYSDYVLNGIQLDEALAIQETQVKYRDALAKAVDDLQENIELQKKSVEQTELLGQKAENLKLLLEINNLNSSNISSFNSAILSPTTSISDQYGSVLYPKLSNQLSIEISNKIQDLPNQIDLPNDQQEQWIETSLQKYIQQKENSITANLNGTDAINTLENLRLEIAHLTLQSEKDPSKIQQFLQDSLSVFNVRDKRLAPSEKTLPNIDGTFDVKSAFTPAPTYSVNNNNFNYRTGDFNGDGKTDLIHLVNSGNGYVHVWNSKGDGTFDVKSAFTPAPGYSVNNNNFNYQTGDFNGDGKTDLIHLVNSGNGYVHVWLSKGDGTFDVKSAFTPAPSYSVNNNNFNFQTGDFNGDGKTDFIHLVNSGNGYVHVWLSKGDGTFDVKSAFTPAPNYSVNNNNFNFKLGDFNGDGKTDLIHLVNSGNGYVHVWNSKGDGTFDVKSAFTPAPTYSVNNNNFNFQTGDFNADGKTDLTHLVNSGNGYVHVWTSNGDSEATIKKEANDALQVTRNNYYPELNQANALAALQTQINNEIGQSQQQIEQLKASITQKQAQSAAALSQADWYEQQAATHWQLSRKQGPTWTEERTAKGKSGTSKTVTVTHVDHNWIIYDTYTKQAVSLREQAANLLKGITTDTTNQNTANDILKQWQEASAVADQTALTQADLTALLNQLDADRQLNGDKKQQIADWEKLLPTLQSQLQKAITDAQTAQANTAKEWTEYQTSQDQYQKNLADVLTRRAQLQTQGQILLQEIDNVDEWVNQQNTLLSDEIGQVQALIDQLNNQKAAIPSTLSNDQNLTLKALIDQSIQLLTQKQIVLTAEQSTFTQKQTLLETQKKVIQTQYDLLDAYLENPDKDTTNLEKLLADTSATLAEVKKLAEQAEASSNALTVLMDDVQVSLLLQNDKYLSVIRDKQKTLQDLLAATELQENDTLKATQKQIELNGLQTQLLDVLKKANDAGIKEAAALLKVAQSNDFATVAELYHRDYQDLATDNGGRCSGGIARPEDIQLANYYYNEMLKYRQLKTETEQQVAQFTQLRTLAESQVTALKDQETLAAQELAALKQSIGNSQDQINAKQEELGIAQFRVDALLQLRNWTEQTQVQLLSVEQLNLAQAKLEQDIANNRQYLIDNTVKAQLDQQRLSIERDRQIAVVKLEQLNQLKTEEALQTAINNLRTDLGVNPITEIIQLADYKGQLAGILVNIETLKQKQPNLPATTKNLLDSTIQDIYAALQGKETQTIQDNLLKSANALIDQSNKLKTEVAKLQQEEQRYINLLSQSQTDLKGATKTLYDEIQKSGVLDSEKTLLNAANLQVLYKIGYAQGAVDLSSALAKQSKDILEQVINGRIEERKAREKAAFNEIFGTITLAISALAAVLTAGASLAVNAAATGTTATVFGVSASTISYISTTLKAVSASLSAVQAAYNGDLSGAIFNAGMAALGFASVSGATLPNSFQFGDVKTFKDVQLVASSAYSAYKVGESGDSLSSFLNIIAAALPLSGLSQYSYLSQAVLSINSGVQLAEDGDWLAATSSFLAGAFSLGAGLNGGQGSFGINLGASPQLLDIFSTIELAVNVVSGVEYIIEDGNLNGWLSGIQSLASAVTDNINDQEAIDKLTDFKKQLLLQGLLKQPDISDQKIQDLIAKYGDENVLERTNSNGLQQVYTIKSFDLTENNKGGLIIQGEYDSNKPTKLITFGWLSSASPVWAFKVAELLKAIYPNDNIIIGDWSELAQNINYPGAANDTKLAGQAIAIELYKMGVNFSQLEIIGHSLGAQVAANIGEYVKSNNYGNVNSIVALDPARPGFERSGLILFENSSNAGRLDKNDATEVTVIHSDYDSVFSLGYRNYAGTSDIFLPRYVLQFYKETNDHSDAISFFSNALATGSKIDGSSLNQFLNNSKQFSDDNNALIPKNTNSLDTLKTDANNHYSVVSDDLIKPIKVQGTPIYEGIYPGWQTLAAATINGENMLLWRNTAANRLHTWTTDANWNWQSAQGWIDPNSKDGYMLESHFGIVLNRDSIIGQSLNTI
jgi:hypothetical protein